MKRLSFLKLLLNAGLLTFVPVSLLAKKTKTKLMSCSVAGFQYYDGPQLLQSLRKQQPLELKRESENPHDEYAIAVYCKDKKIGFVPRSMNRLLARILDNDLLEVEAEIKEVHSFPDYPEVYIEIFTTQHKIKTG